RGELLLLEAEAVAEEVVADGPTGEGEGQLEDAGQLRLDAVEDGVGEAFGLEAGGGDVRAAFGGGGAAAVADDVVDLPGRVAEARQGGRQRGVDDLEVAAAGELLELDQGEVGLDAGGVAIHEQSNRAGRRDTADLGVAVAVLFAQREHPITLQPG